ncbi:Galactokinase protein [Raphanus sativus]|nr:Galactokinase protein [Raphanus sativus]
MNRPVIKKIAGGVVPYRWNASIVCWVQSLVQHDNARGPMKGGIRMWKNCPPRYDHGVKREVKVNLVYPKYDHEVIQRIRKRHDDCSVFVNKDNKKGLNYYQGGVEMIRRDLLAGCWAPYLERAVTLKPCYDGGIDGGEVAAKILQDTAMGKKRSKLNLSGVKRLQDAIILGFQLQRAPGRDLSVPEWYQVAGDESGTTLVDQTQNSSKFVEGFEILHGDHLGLIDTISFLDSLATLAKIGGHHQEREHLAAAALFNWEEDIVVARAPGRLDVMGGITDYSESLVLLVNSLFIKTKHRKKKKKT